MAERFIRSNTGAIPRRNSDRARRNQMIRFAAMTNQANSVRKIQTKPKLPMQLPPKMPYKEYYPPEIKAVVDAIVNAFRYPLSKVLFGDIGDISFATDDVGGEAGAESESDTIELSMPEMKVPLSPVAEIYYPFNNNYNEDPTNQLPTFVLRERNLQRSRIRTTYKTHQPQYPKVRNYSHENLENLLQETQLPAKEYNPRRQRVHLGVASALNSFKKMEKNRATVLPSRSLTNEPLQEIKQIEQVDTSNQGENSPEVLNAIQRLDKIFDFGENMSMDDDNSESESVNGAYSLDVLDKNNLDKIVDHVREAYKVGDSSNSSLSSLAEFEEIHMVC